MPANIGGPSGLPSAFHIHSPLDHFLHAKSLSEYSVMLAKERVTLEDLLVATDAELRLLFKEMAIPLGPNMHFPRASTLHAR